MMLHVVLVVVIVVGATAAAAAPCTKHTATVIVKYPSKNLPSGAELTLRGDNGGLNWSTGVPLSNGGGGGGDEWTTTLTFDSGSSSATVDMKVMVNDQVWQIGANTQFSLDWSSSSSSLSSSSSSSCDLQLSVFPHFYTQTGRYTQPEGNLYSKYFDNYRDVILYLPASYDENPNKSGYPTIIMHDGENLFNASTSFGGVAWMCQNTVDALAFSGAMSEVIIVGVYNTLKRMAEYTYSVDPTYGGGDGDHYLDWLEEVAVPYVVQRGYRIGTTRDKLSMIGSSLGGLISCYAGWTRWKVYGRVGCMSSSFWWNAQDFNTTILVDRAAPEATTEFYLDSGDAGDDHDDEQETRTVRGHMEVLGWKMNNTLWYYLDHGGQHNEYYWGRRFWVISEDLYPPSVQLVKAV